MSQALRNFRNFKMAGPVAAAFLSDRASRVKLLRGPVGSGKTVSNIFDGIMAASTVMPICKDGKIHVKDAVIGATYGQLERNLYPSWKHWIPETGGWAEGEWEGGGGRFATHSLTFDVLRGGRRVQVVYQAIFSAIGEQSVEQFMRGFEPSMWYLFEADQLPEGTIEQAVGRLGRYPNADMLPPGAEWRGYVRGDCNAPDIDSNYYKLVEEVKPEGLRQFVQPSGLSPQAENLHNLPKGYYQNLATLNAHKPRWVRRFVKNQYGPSDEGEPVFPEFDDTLHMAQERIAFDPNLPVLLGFDQGLRNPAMVAGQRRRNGQLRVLLDFLPGRMSARRFAQLSRQILAERCPNATIECGFADPAGFDGADKEDDQLAWAETVSLEMGIPILPAPTNEIDPRLDAVRDELTYVIEPGVPGILLSPGDTMVLRKGFASDYQYRRIRVGNTDRFEGKPDKSRPAANVHDALQYLILGEKGRYGVIAGRKGAAKVQAQGSTTKVIKDGGMVW